MCFNCMAYPVILPPDQVVAPGKWQVLALISVSGGAGVVVEGEADDVTHTATTTSRYGGQTSGSGLARAAAGAGSCEVLVTTAVYWPSRHHHQTSHHPRHGLLRATTAQPLTMQWLHLVIT